MTYDAFGDYDTTPPDDDRYNTATVVERTDTTKGEVYGYPLAPLWRRYLGMAVDAAFIFLAPTISFGVFMKFGFFELLGIEPQTTAQEGTMLALAIGVSALWTLGMNIFLGSSVGKYAAHTQLAYPMRDSMGHLWFCKPPVMACLKRVVVWPIYSMAFYAPQWLMPAITKHRQSLGDWWSGTVTVTNYFPTYDSGFMPPKATDEMVSFWDRHGRRLVRANREWTRLL